MKSAIKYNRFSSKGQSTWHRSLNTQRLQLRSSIELLNKDDNQLHFLLQENLGRLSDLQHIYTNSSSVQKQELLRQVFDNGLYYQHKAYRTPYVMPVFTHNLLTLKQKSLLFVDGNGSLSGQVEAISPLSNNFIGFLSFLDTVRVA